MVRIVNDKREPLAREEILSARSKALLQMLSIVLAEQPGAIDNLLTDYQIELSDQPTDKERTEKLLSAIAACDHRFNLELAKLIFDCTAESAYDNFDFKGLFKKGDAGDEDLGNSGGNAGGGGGLFAGIANAVGGIGGAIGQGIKGKQAKDLATSQTLQGIYNYKAQLVSNEKSKGKNKMLMVISMVALILIVLAAIAYKQNQAKPQLQTV
jgi:hypothetical protein